MSYIGTGIVYRPDKLPDGGQPGDILILDPGGNPAWLTPGGGSGGSSGLHGVLLLGNSAGNLTIQEITTVSGPYQSSTGHVSHLDFIPSSAVGGKISMAGGGNTLGDAGGGILFLDGADGTKGGVAALRGGAGGLGSTGALLSMGGGGTGLGGGVFPGGGGDFLIEGGNSVGILPGGEGYIRAGASADGQPGGYIYLGGGFSGMSAGNAQLRGGDVTTDGRRGGLIGANGGTVGSSGGQVSASAGAIDSAAQGGTLVLSGASTTEGGQAQLRGGNSLGTGGSTGAFLQVSGGQVSGAGGPAFLGSGAAKPATNANGGNLTLEPGLGDGTGRRGLLVVPNLPLAVPTSPVAGAVWRTPQGFLTMHPHFCVNWPITFKSVDYTFAIDDGGKMFAHSGDVTARTWTIPANASVALAPGTAILLVNHNGAGVITIAITTDVMLLAGVGVKTTIAIAPSGEATLVKIDSTKWIVKGTGLTGLP